MLQKIRTHWQFLLYLIGAVFLRFWNFRHSLYFIYDQGRDAVALQKIAHGHFVLVGPTTGLNGIFLGPLWWYFNLPAFILGGGSPWVIALWDITFSCTALPLFWWLAHRLFKTKPWAIICAVFFAVIPGSIHASIFVWNPLLSVPFMTGALVSLYKARTSRLWLAIGFLLLALTLQSEFAYAVFFMPVLFAAIPWIRKKFDIKDFVVVIVTTGTTLIPQALFDLRNHFIMTQSLLRSLQDSSQSVSWAQLFAQRPGQLLDISSAFFLNDTTVFAWMIPILLILVVIGFITAAVQQKSFLWRLTALFAFIPYPFFLLWRGNHGYFFNYYITCHFVFVVPMLVCGIQSFWKWLSFTKPLKFLATVAIIGIFATLSFSALKYWNDSVFAVQNNAGLDKILTASATIYNWAQQDNISQPVVRTYTANVYTEQYDYLLSWYAKTHHFAAPVTVRGNEKTWYIIIESRDQAQKIFFDPWYAAATQGGQLIRHTQVGVLTLETWQKK